jgi:guanylate kinase
MNKLIILAGASGAGKSFLLQQMSKINKNIAPIKKLTTRKARPYESSSCEIDLIFGCDSNDIKEKCKYNYIYDGETYGIIKEEIDNALFEGKSPFVIVRDCEEILDMKNDYPGKTITLYMQSGFSGSDLEEVLRKQGRDDIDISKRDRRTRHDYEKYRIYCSEFDGVLINYFEEEPLISHFKTLLKNEELKDPTIHKDIFVLMSFNDDMANTYEEMTFAIDQLNNELNFKEKLNIHRVDDQRGGTYLISDTILKQINQAEVILCDLTQEKQNVYFELGYAIAKKKTIIITAQKDTKIQFDVAGYKINFYNNITELKKKLLLNLKCLYSKP